MITPSRVITALTVSLTLTACNSSGTAETADESDELQEISVATLPLIHQAPLYLGIEQGFFEDEGIELDAEIYQGFQPMIAAANNGEVQFGFTSTTPILAAQTSGISLRIVAAGDRLGNDDSVDSPDALVVSPGSEYSSISDLSGATVGVSNIQGIQHLAVLAGIDNAGGDSSETTFVDIPFSDVLPALDSDRVGVATTTEPYLTSQGDDVEVLSYYMAAGLPDLPTTSYFSTTDYATENPEVVESFVAALERSTEYALENPDAVRAVLGEYTQIEEDIASEVELPLYDTEINESDVSTMSDLLYEYDFVSEPVDADSILE